VRPEAGSTVRLAELIAALSLATDLAMGQPMEHALRTCVLAVRLGDALSLSQDELSTVYYVALLRFLGCTTEASVAAETFGDEIAARSWIMALYFGPPARTMAGMLRHVGEGNPPLRRARQVAHAFAMMPKLTATIIAHCEVAQRLAERLGCGPEVQWALWHVYERWDGRGDPGRIKGAGLALPMRVVQLAQDAVAFHRWGGVDAATTMARERAGRAYDPAIVERFCKIAPELLAGADSGSAWDAALAAEPGPWAWVSEFRLDEALRAIADFVDLKSPYLVGHSSGVAQLAATAASWLKLPDRDVTAIRRAALLHDLGRVGISSAIWGKPGPLTDTEWERVRLHPYYAERVLARPKALAHLGALAALHHERLDGSGYHRNASASLLPITARILAAADVYHAMIEPRPHRPARPAEQAADELRREARAGRLDGEAVQAVLGAAGNQVRGGRREWPAGLTQREVEVLRLVARGCSNRAMAEQLSLSGRTVQHHVEHIYDKIGVSTRAGASVFAMQHDLMGEGAVAS
jgi:HD-GYP domain-containing protein (c-di-GMP phosphodiesterase class II)